MLNKSSVEISANVSEVLVDRQIKLSPKGNTLLSELSSVIKNACFENKFLDRDSVIRAVENASIGETTVSRDNNSVYIGSEHDAIMDNYINDMSLLVGNYLSFSRTVVNSQMSEFKESLLESINAYRYKDPEDFFEVSYFTLPEIFKGQLVRDETRGFKGKDTKYVRTHLNIKALEEEESLQEYFMTGHEETDKEITSWLSSVNWTKGALFDEINELSLSLPDSLTYGLVNFIFYRNLAERTNINTGDSTVTLRRKASENRDYFASFLASTLALYTTYIRSGKLLGSDTNTNFSYLNEGPFKVTIFEDNFEKAAEAGCTIETVFGFLSSTSSSLSLNVNDLVTEKDKYNTTWSRTRNLYLIHLNNKRLDTFKHLVRVKIDEALHKDKVTESEEEMMAKDAGFVITTLKMSHAYVDGLSVPDIEDVDKLCLDLVAKIRFRFTDSYLILKDMDDLLKADENLDPKEAGLYAAISYLVDYCLQQVEVVKV